MPPQLSGDDIDDLLYFARIGDQQEYDNLTAELCKREHTTAISLLHAARDPFSSNGPMHMVAANGHTGILTAIILALGGPSPSPDAAAARRSVLNAQNAAGNTALHWAALNGHLACVKLLLDAGADPTITNRAGHDAVYEAELNDKREVVEWVLKEAEGLQEGFGKAVESEEDAEGDADGGGRTAGMGLEEGGGALEPEGVIKMEMEGLSVKDGIEEPQYHQDQGLQAV